jgi:hypothetical protein
LGTSVKERPMKPSLIASLFVFSGCLQTAGPTSDDPSGGKADDDWPVNKNNEDVHMVFAEVIDLENGQIHVGDLNTNNEHPDVPDEVAIGLRSADCQLLAQKFPFTEWDCSEAFLDAVVEHEGTLAGSPLIYPVVHRGGFDAGMVPSFGRWESNSKVIRIVVAVKKSAWDSPTFQGVGFHRVGYEFRVDFMFSDYEPGSLGEKLFKLTTETISLVEERGKVLAEGTRRDPDGDEPVVFVQYLYMLNQSIKRPWFTGDGYAWVPPSSGVSIKPFASYRDGGTTYRNWDSRGVDYRVDRDDKGIAVDYRSEFTGLP